MAPPPWITFICGLMVIIFGGYRIMVGLRSDEAQARASKKKGMYALPRRRHVLFGIVYLIMGTFLILISLGIDPTGLK